MSLPRQKKELKASTAISLKDLCEINDIKGWEKLEPEWIAQINEVMGCEVVWIGNSFYNAPENENRELALMKSSYIDSGPFVIVYHRVYNKIPKILTINEKSFECAYYQRYLISLPMVNDPDYQKVGLKSPNYRPTRNTFKTLEEIGSVFRAALNLRSFL